MTKELAKPDAPPVLSETAMLIQQAQAAGMVPEKLYEILDKEREDRRKMAFTAAFAAFQAECPPTIKRSAVTLTRGGAKTSYASLQDIRSHVDPYLRKHGFALSYGTANDMQTVTLMHRDGHSISQTVPFAPDNPKTSAMNELQKVGSGLSYAMRYATVQILGLWFVDKDLDGNDPDDGKPVTQAQADTVQDLIIQSEANRGNFLRFFGINKVSELPASRFEEACQMLNDKIREAGKG